MGLLTDYEIKRPQSIQNSAATTKSPDEVNLMRYHLIYTNYIYGRRNRGRGGAGNCRQLQAIAPPPPILVTDSLLINY